MLDEILIKEFCCGVDAIQRKRIAALESDLAKLKYLLKAVCDELDYDYTEGPGHNHSTPGVWDNDNKPELAGKPCAWCALWNEIREMTDNI